VELLYLCGKLSSSSIFTCTYGIRIYGGGYTGGNKQSQGNPSGLIKASQKAGGQGIIFVAMNYRLGALGFMAGPSLQAAGGVSNAAFYDQRLAIEWVAKNIHLFGGDPKKITIMGESAGGKLRKPYL
jgi:carboxylesterase type B